MRVKLRGCLKPLGARIVVTTISITDPIVRRKQRRGVKWDGREDSSFLISKAVLLGLFALCYLGLSREVILDAERRR